MVWSNLITGVAEQSLVSCAPSGLAHFWTQTQDCAPLRPGLSHGVPLGLLPRGGARRGTACLRGYHFD
jgi:hypothetical protein